jgi:hypothetical protein
MQRSSVDSHEEQCGSFSDLNSSNLKTQSANYSSGVAQNVLCEDWWARTDRRIGFDSLETFYFRLIYDAAIVKA